MSEKRRYKEPHTLTMRPDMYERAMMEASKLGISFAELTERAVSLCLEKHGRKAEHSVQSSETKQI